ncbi:MAG: DUF3014 domain-containing protein [Woeseiaceae bacterium]|nr:DUF3014 domain-containing protein [Woeseiaceae bacterium]
MSDTRTNWWVAAVVVVAIGLAAWYFLGREAPVAPVATPAPAAAEAPAPAGPRHPLPAPAAGVDDAALTPLPPLDDSDGYFALEIGNVLSRDIDELLADSNLIEKFVTTVDNLPRARIAERVRPLRPLPSEFRAGDTDSADEFVLAAENYRRYDALVAMVTAADLEAVVDTYRRFYPLLQEAYVGLGYPDGYFNDRVIEVIDHLLETPVPEEPVRLVRPHVLYEFADPELESLSSGRKMLIRMGPDNAAALKAVLAKLRDRLAAEPRAQAPAVQP